MAKRDDAVTAGSSAAGVPAWLSSSQASTGGPAQADAEEEDDEDEQEDAGSPKVQTDLTVVSTPCRTETHCARLTYLAGEVVRIQAPLPARHTPCARGIPHREGCAQEPKYVLSAVESSTGEEAESCVLKLDRVRFSQYSTDISQYSTDIFKYSTDIEPVDTSAVPTTILICFVW
jgi:hypothetical protein